MMFSVLEDVTLADVPVVSRTGSQSIRILLGEEDVPAFQTPRMDLRAGVQVAVWGGQPKRHIDVYFRDSLPHQHFQQAFRNFDEKIIQTATKNSKEWFRQEMDVSDVTRLYTSYMRADEEDVWLKVNLPFRGDKCTARVFDNHTQVDSLAAGDGCGRSAVLVMQPVSLWFFNQKFGVKWNVHELHLSPKAALSCSAPEQNPDSLFLADDDDD